MELPVDSEKVEPSDGTTLSKEESLETSKQDVEQEIASDATSLKNETVVLSCDWTTIPQLLCKATKEYEPSESYENFTKGCKWSPDGTCLLVPSEDFRIRIYELPRDLYSGKIPSNFKVIDWRAVLTIKEGGLVYDTCWYPFMNSWLPETCCFLSASQESPVHLWDAFSGELRATYRAYNNVDEVEPAISVQFVEDGKQVWSGYKNVIRIFDTERPGRQIENIHLKKDFPNTSGLVSCIKENPLMPGLIALGTYSKCVGLYKDGPLCTLKTASGVTQIEFSPCGTKLYTAVRRNNEFLCWDLRNPGIVLYTLHKRESDTNQRIQFDVLSNGNEIISGGTDGYITYWETSKLESDEEDLQPTRKIQISQDCVNGVNVHRSLPIVATSSGQRICDDECDSVITCRDNSVCLWWLSQRT